MAKCDLCKMREAVERDATFIWETLSVPLATTTLHWFMPWHFWQPSGSLCEGSVTARSGAIIPGAGSLGAGWRGGHGQQAGRSPSEAPTAAATADCWQVSRGPPKLPHSTGTSAPVCQHLQRSGKTNYHISDRDKSKDKRIVYTEVHQQTKL